MRSWLQAREAGLAPDRAFGELPGDPDRLAGGWDTGERLLGDGVLALRPRALQTCSSPLPEVTAEDLGLKPVMTVGSYIAAVKGSSCRSGRFLRSAPPPPQAATLAGAARLR